MDDKQPHGPANVFCCERHRRESQDETSQEEEQSGWSLDEDQSILDFVKYGMNDWHSISRHLPGRCALSCSIRFKEYLKPRAEAEFFELSEKENAASSRLPNVNAGAQLRSWGYVDYPAVESRASPERRSASVSSVSSMIEDRMRMADEERSRPVTPTVPPSPFRSESAFEREYIDSGRASDASMTLGTPERQNQTAQEINEQGRLACQALAAQQTATPVRERAEEGDINPHPICDINRTPSLSPPYMRPAGQGRSMPAIERLSIKSPEAPAENAATGVVAPCLPDSSPLYHAVEAASPTACLPRPAISQDDTAPMQGAARDVPLLVEKDALESDRGRKRRRESPGKAGPSHSCDTCGKIFGRRNLLANHTRTHTGERPFACSQPGCGQTFKQKNEQTRHERTAHGGEKAFVCGGLLSSGGRWGCGKTFARSDGLLEHQTKTEKGRRCLRQRDEG